MCSFRCGRVHIGILQKKVVSYTKEPFLIKQELEHDETYEDTFEVKENEWLPYFKNNVTSSFQLC